MKIRKPLSLVLAGFVLILSFACNRSNKTKTDKGTTSEGKEMSVEVDEFDPIKLKNQLVETIENAPKPEEISNFLNSVGASYILDLTVPVDAADKFMTETDQSIALGLYGFDLVYAKTYQRGDMVAQLAEVENKMIDKLGVGAAHNQYAQYGERIKANIDDKDSIDALVTAMMNDSYQKFMSCEHTYQYALSFIASNIEGLYILTQLTMLAQNNAPMIEFLGQQGERAKSVYALLEIMSEDENVKPLYTEITPLIKFFEENESFGEEQLNAVVPMIESIRNTLL